jgi:beta-galactosidase
MATAEITCFDGEGNEIRRFERTYRWGRFATVYDMSHWNWTEGESVKAGCMATGDEVELFVNGESAGRRPRDAESGRFEWTVPFEPGEIKFIVFRDGHPIGEGWRKTAGSPFAVKVTTEAKSLADGEVGFARAELVDDEGVVVPSANGEVAFSVEGPGELLCASGSLERGAAVAVFRRKVGSGRPLKIGASFAGVRAGAADLPRNAD